MAYFSDVMSPPKSSTPALERWMERWRRDRCFDSVDEKVSEPDHELTIFQRDGLRPDKDLEFLVLVQNVCVSIVLRSQSKFDRSVFT